MATRRRSGSRRTRAARAPGRTVRAPRERTEDPQQAVALADRPVIGCQRWDDVLFLHWAVDPAALRPLVDRRLALDLRDGAAWISLTPFTLRGGRLRLLPPLPFISCFHELNLRTYVRVGDVPGLWFFSLDAASAPAAAIARASLGLPYFRARMRRASSGGRNEFRSERLLPRSRPASLSCAWRAGARRAAPPGSLDHFLAERYALYSVLAGRLLRVRVRHEPWILHDATVEEVDETVTRAAGVSAVGPPLAAWSSGVDVAVLAPERIEAGRTSRGPAR